MCYENPDETGRDVFLLGQTCSKNLKIRLFAN